VLIVKWVRLRKKSIVFIMGTPMHNNLGDQAITYAETEFIKLYIPNAKIIIVPMQIIMKIKLNTLSCMVSSKDVLIGHGGGNMGDMYMTEELCRRRFIQLFPNNKIIIFPQTIYFSETKKGLMEIKKTQTIYSRHNDLTLIAREQTSYEKMLLIFRANTVMLTPDIVLSIEKSDITTRPRSGALVCLRADAESNLSIKDKQKITDFITSHYNKIKYTDTISRDKFFFIRSKSKAVQAKLDEFRLAKFVITDRLHGMVFSAITGTPCIAIANFNHKVDGTYKWVSYLPYIKFCNNIDNLEILSKQIKVNQTYKYNPNHFRKYWNMIEEILINRQDEKK
jgi:pyruvyl transferase EpsI